MSLIPKMTDEQEKEVIDALVDFVIRVAKGKTTSDTEVSVLPEVAKVLLSYDMYKEEFFNVSEIPLKISL